MRMKKHTQHLIAEVPRRSSRVGMTIGIDLGDIWSHYCTLNEEARSSIGAVSAYRNTVEKQHASQPTTEAKTPREGKRR